MYRGCPVFSDELDDPETNKEVLEIEIDDTKIDLSATIQHFVPDAHQLDLVEFIKKVVAVLASGVVQMTPTQQLALVIGIRKQLCKNIELSGNSTTKEEELLKA